MEEEKKNGKIGFGRAFLIVLLTAIATAGILVGAYFLLIKPSQKTENPTNNEVANNVVNEIENNTTNTTENVATNSKATNVFENYMEKSLQPTKRFVITSVEEKSDSYVVSAYLLKDDYERISQETFDKIVNEGATISFRGKEYKFSKNFFGELGDEYGYIALTSVSGDSSTALAKLYDASTKKRINEYTFYQSAGKESYVKDYASNTPVKFEVKKDIKTGDTFETFYIDYDGKVYVKNYENVPLEQDETTTREFFNREDIYKTTQKYGECEAYLLDNEVVAIKTYAASAP